MTATLTYNPADRNVLGNLERALRRNTELMREYVTEMRAMRLAGNTFEVAQLAEMLSVLRSTRNYLHNRIARAQRNWEAYGLPTAAFSFGRTKLDTCGERRARRDHEIGQVLERMARARASHAQALTWLRTADTAQTRAEQLASMGAARSQLSYAKFELGLLQRTAA